MIDDNDFKEVNTIIIDGSKTKRVNIFNVSDVRFILENNNTLLRIKFKE